LVLDGLADGSLASDGANEKGIFGRVVLQLTRPPGALTQDDAALGSALLLRMTE
jgi:hypothetical protein